ncbi:hypothetical protein ACQPWR_13910 [Micromonospora vinacea]|uniref:hypothetical protein n=1 Tax=Micromonospora vinacea TaxID=709878 RepID=UPI003D9453A2
MAPALTAPALTAPVPTALAPTAPGTVTVAVPGASLTRTRLGVAAVVRVLLPSNC